MPSLIKLQVSAHGNCTPQDDTIGCTSWSVHVPSPKQEAPNPDELSSAVDLDHHYTSVTRLSVYAENVIVYVSGWVVRKLLRTLHWDECRFALIEQEDASSNKSYTLLRLKQKGGLYIPSKSVISVISVTEKQIRLGTQMDKVNQKMSMLKIQTAVLALRLDVCTAKHSIETQHGLDNHNTSLIRMLVSVYVNMRQHHVVRLHNEKVGGPNVPDTTWQKQSCLRDSNAAYHHGN